MPAPATMRAVVYDHYGPPDVLRVADVPVPEPAPGEVRVRVIAATMNRLDCHTREANRSNGVVISIVSRLVSGLWRPRRRIQGTEFAGIVEAVAPDVTGLKVGDEVFGNTGLRFGTQAERVCVRQDGLVARKPPNLVFAEAAALTDGALNALWCLRLGRVGAGSSVLIYGASGAIGTAGIQVARHLGAEVSAVCGTANLELAARLGAAEVIDYQREDFAGRGRTYDAILDAAGKLSFPRVWQALKPGGCYLPTDGLANLYHAAWTARRVGRRVVFKLPPRYLRADVELIGKLAENGGFRPVIDRTYPLGEAALAARYVETGEKVGNVILEVASNPLVHVPTRSRSMA